VVGEVGVVVGAVVDVGMGDAVGVAVAVGGGGDVGVAMRDGVAVGVGDGAFDGGGAGEGVVGPEAFPAIAWRHAFTRFSIFATRWSSGASSRTRANRVSYLSPTAAPPSSRCRGMASHSRYAASTSTSSGASSSARW